jgi:hypothetical protein
MMAHGVIPHVLEEELGLGSAWTSLFAGVLLLLTLLLFPGGIAGVRCRGRPAIASGR